MQPNIKIVGETIEKEALKKFAKERFGDLVKIVVDIEREIMALDGELHSDEEEALLDNGSKQKDLWGINIYPDRDAKNMIEFDSMINIRPSQNNKSRYVEDEGVRKKIEKIVNKYISA